MRTTRTTQATFVAMAIALAACGGSDDSADANGSTDPAGSVAPASSAPADTDAAATTATTAPATTSVPATSVAQSTTTTKATTTTSPSDWRNDVAAFCSALFDGIAAVAPHDGSASDITRYINDLPSTDGVVPPFNAIGAPPEVQPALDEIAVIWEQVSASVSNATQSATAGDAATAADALGRAVDDVNRMRGLFALAGATCDTADTGRAQAGALNIPTEGNTFMINAGFGSIWASQTRAGRVTRHDPETGAVIATIDVGPGAVKLQAADGRMWVRTADRYVAIDPATNTVAATVDKAAVGPAANRSFATDGALWICDGRRLHRYDPTTLQPVAVVDLDAECEEVYATGDLVVTYRTNEDPAQSGAAAATFVDPASNQVLATVSLPVDVAYPAVLDAAVFFPGQDGPTAVVVDRATWTVSATPDLGRPTRVGLTATDGDRIYAPLAGYRDVVVIDAATLEVVDTIDTLGNAAPVLVDGSLWTADSWYGLMQRHDLG